MNLISQFEQFRRSHVLANPGPSELTAFTQSLADAGTLGEFTDEDWLDLSRKLGLTDDQYAALFEGTASWIVDEGVPVQDQEPADWPDELPAGAAGGSSRPRPNPSSRPSHRQVAPRSARRGTPEFEDLMDEVLDEWELDDEELENIVEVRRAGDSFEIRLKGETRWELLEEEGDDEDGVAGPEEDFGGAEE